MAIKIQNTSDIIIDGVKCVVFGFAGTGKTRLCASAPTPLIISAERGLLSLTDKACDYINVSNLKQWDEVYKFVKSSKEAEKYETICLDSLSEIAEVLITELLPNYKNAKQAYGQLAISMMPMLRKFRDLPGKHTLFTCKAITIKDEDTEAVTIEVMMPGKVLPSQIPYMVDELFYLKSDRKGNPILQTRPDRTTYCKDRSGALAANILNPDMTEIINSIMAKSGQAKG